MLWTIIVILVILWPLFRSEYKSKVPAHRQLDSYFDRYRRHTHPIEPPWGSVNLFLRSRFARPPLPPAGSLSSVIGGMKNDQ
jgi:hypothetical protein